MSDSEPGAAEVQPIPEARTPETKDLLWSNTIKAEARSILGKYLPDALPQELTEVMVWNIQPFTIGKFRGKHYIALENTTSEMEWIEKAKRDLDRVGEMIKGPSDEEQREFQEFLLNLQTKVQAGEQLTEEDQELTPKSKPPALEPEPEENIDWADRLEQGSDHWSSHTWRDIHSLTHEMIHQRQEELNPEAFPELSSPELDNINPDTMDSRELRSLLTEAHRKQTRRREEIGGDSIFYPVIEGMAVVGSYYAMAGLESDLRVSGNIKTADTVRKSRQQAIYHDLEARRQLRRGEDIRDYQIYYVNGVNMMRKLYKKFGIEGTIDLLKRVDLAACQKITKGSPEYQAMMEDPTKLPGFESGLPLQDLGTRK